MVACRSNSTSLWADEKTLGLAIIITVVWKIFTAIGCFFMCAFIVHYRPLITRRVYCSGLCREIVFDAVCTESGEVMQMAPLCTQILDQTRVLASCLLRFTCCWLPCAVVSHLPPFGPFA